MSDAREKLIEQIKRLREATEKAKVKRAETLDTQASREKPAN